MEKSQDFTRITRVSSIQQPLHSHILTTSRPESFTINEWKRNGTCDHDHLFPLTLPVSSRMRIIGCLLTINGQGVIETDTLTRLKRLHKGVDLLPRIVQVECPRGSLKLVYYLFFLGPCVIPESVTSERKKMDIRPPTQNRAEIVPSLDLLTGSPTEARTLKIQTEHLSLPLTSNETNSLRKYLSDPAPVVLNGPLDRFQVRLKGPNLPLTLRAVDLTHKV